MKFKIILLSICSSLSVSLSAQEADIIQIAKYKDDKTCAISYTFDDGLKEHYTLVTPKFQELGFKGTFWINGSKVNQDENNITDTTRVTWMELKEMSDLGHEISNHGWAHKNFGRHTLEEIKEDIFKNDSAIVANIGIIPRTFCYPNNAKTPEGLKLASENRVGTRTKQRSIGGKATHENLDMWVNTLIETKDWGIGMTHGITYGYDKFSSADIFWQHLLKVKTMEDQIWVATFHDVSAYTAERDSTTLQIEEKGENKYIVTPSCPLDKSLFKESLTAVVAQPNIKKISVFQNGKKLKAKIFSDKAVFDFDPYGGVIEVELD